MGDNHHHRMSFPRSELSVSSFPLKESFLPRAQRKQIDSNYRFETESNEFGGGRKTMGAAEDERFYIYPDNLPPRMNKGGGGELTMTTPEFVYNFEERRPYIKVFVTISSLVFKLLEKILPEDVLHMLEVLKYENSVTSVDKIYCEHILPLISLNKGASESTKLFMSMITSYIIKKAISVMKARQYFEDELRLRLEKILLSIMNYMNGEKVNILSLFDDEKTNVAPRGGGDHKSSASSTSTAAFRKSTTDVNFDSSSDDDDY